MKGFSNPFLGHARWDVNSLQRETLPYMGIVISTGYFCPHIMTRQQSGQNFISRQMNHIR